MPNFRIWLGILIVIVIGCSCATENTSTEAVTLRAEIGYWNETQPSLIEMRDTITPIATRLIDMQPALDQRDLDAWKELATEMAPVTVEVYRNVLKVYVLVKTPIASNLPEMKRLRADEMNAKISAMQGISAGWDTGDDELMIESYLDFFDATSNFGRKIDELRIDLGRRINEGCKEMRLRECSSMGL